MVTREQDEKITYTTMSVDQSEAFNRHYDEALFTAGESLGASYPAWIGGRQVGAQSMFEVRSPCDTRLILGSFQDCTSTDVGQAVKAARVAFEIWSHTPWRDRLTVLREAANNFRGRKYEIAAWLTLEAGKPRLEAMGEVEEAADLITTYCDQMEEHDGFIIKLKQLSPREINHSVLRPYGVWSVIAPFNFPIALATGMVAGALIAGNTVVFKPSPETPLAGIKVYECLAEAGLPAGAINLLTGSGDGVGESMVSNPQVDGVAFTGSKPVGTRIYREFSAERPQPCIVEMGGKNPVIVTAHADLDKAVEGIVRAAFGYSGQKCSAASRAYVHADVAARFVEKLRERTGRVTLGNPADTDVFMGPVINESSYRRFQQACRTSADDGEILFGGDVATAGELRHGYYCAPTVCVLRSDHPYFLEELFVPLLVVAEVSSLDEALTLANDSEFGLTAGIFSEDHDEVRTFLDRMEAGVLYVNRQGGATTGAWPGVQSFGGWKASGSTGKSALGPYYVQQFMHEQTQTVVSD